MPIYYPPAGVSGSSGTISGSLAISGDISPLEITADQNNYAPTGYDSAAVFRLASNTAVNLTGIAGGGDGRLLLLKNVGTFNITLKNANTSSNAANRFAFSDNGSAIDRTVYPGRAVELYYDPILSRWTDKVTLSSTTAALIRAGLDNEKYVTALNLALAQTPQTLTYAANVTPNVANGFNMEIVLTGNPTFLAPTNVRKGGVYTMATYQDNVGGRTAVWANSYDWGLAGAPTLSTGANKMDMVTMICYDDTPGTPKLRCSVNRAG